MRIELTTPGLQDQCSNHWAMEADGPTPANYTCLKTGCEKKCSIFRHCSILLIFHNNVIYRCGSRISHSNASPHLDPSMNTMDGFNECAFWNLRSYTRNSWLRMERRFSSQFTVEMPNEDTLRLRAEELQGGTSFHIWTVHLAICWVLCHSTVKWQNGHHCPFQLQFYA